MDVVIEFEGYQLKNGFCFKELCVFFVKEDFRVHFFIKSQNEFKYLSKADKRTLKFCEKYLHKLFWRAGHIEQGYLMTCVKNLIEPNATIFTKKESKVNILKNELKNIAVKNVDNIFSKEAIKSAAFATTSYPLRFHRGVKHCAVHKARRLAEAILGTYTSESK